MTVEYKFADGTVSEVEVSEEIGTYIMDSRRKENSANRKERYHCSSLDAILYEGSEFGYEEGNYLEEQEDTALLKEVLDCLTETQRRRMLLFIEGLYQYCTPKMALHATFDTIFIAVGLVTDLWGAVTAFERGVTSKGNDSYDCNSFAFSLGNSDFNRKFNLFG